MKSKSVKNDVRISRLIRKEIVKNHEHKVLTLGTPTGGNWTTAGTVTPLTYPIGQGDNMFQRNGDQITQLMLRMVWNTASTGAGNSTQFRIIIFSDRDASGGAPAVVDVLDTADYRSTYHLPNNLKKRYHFYYDKSYRVVTGTNYQVLPLQMEIPLGNLKTWFQDSTNATTNIGRNHLHALVISSSIGNGGFSFNYGLEFVDV
jgi:hypothetical protein